MYATKVCTHPPVVGDETRVVLLGAKVGRSNGEGIQKCSALLDPHCTAVKVGQQPGGAGGGKEDVAEGKA